MPGIRNLVFRTIQSYVNRKFTYKKDHIIDIHVNTEVLTTGLVIPSGTLKVLRTDGIVRLKPLNPYCIDKACSKVLSIVSFLSRCERTANTTSLAGSHKIL